MVNNPSPPVEVFEVEVPAHSPASLPIPLLGVASGAVLFNGSCRITGGTILNTAASGSNVRFFDSGSGTGLEVAVSFVPASGLTTVNAPIGGILVNSAVSWTYSGTPTLEGDLYLRPRYPR